MHKPKNTAITTQKAPLVRLDELAGTVNLSAKS